MSWTSWKGVAEEDNVVMNESISVWRGGESGQGKNESLLQATQSNDLLFVK